ncbi:MAG TPA: very short patch repair endonuclease [Verrucomicrobiae bacterium]|nr:very short patch repair endonuclease [Verrucomicrobiae bacterium]
MADVFSKPKRSAIMARVRSQGNERTELALLNILRRNKLTGWRRHPSLFGNPDFVFQKFKLAIFVDGCFWHGCPRHATQPASNRAFWQKKLARNKKRDRTVNQTLRQFGWKILRIWQHELKRSNEPRLVRRIQRALPPLDSLRHR